MGFGYGGRRIGVIGRLVAAPSGRRFSFDLRGIVLGLQEDLEPQRRMISLGYVVGARYQMSRDAAVLFEFEHNGSEALGQQFRVLALLDLGFWI